MIVKIKRLIYRTLLKVIYFFDIKERMLISKMRKEGVILKMKDIPHIFKKSSFFAFATGGSLSNISNMSLLKDKNILILGRGMIQFYIKYNFIPNIWFLHNPDSIEMSILDIKKYKLEKKIDFSETFILIPSNQSFSKECGFSSKVFKKLRRLIGDSATFVLYEEDFRPIDSNENIKDYLSFNEPIRFINGSAVENAFIPWLGFLGVNKIFFCGVDHMDTGHFWDRKELYQDIFGARLNFQEIQTNELIYECGRVARKKCKEKGINVYRLEKEETILQDYEYIDFYKAYSLSSGKITPQDLRL